MKIQKQSDSIAQLRFPFHEAAWIQHAFQRLLEHYTPDLEELSEQERAYWKGDLRDPSASPNALPQESEFLEIERLEWKNLRGEKVRAWLQSLRNDPTHEETLFSLPFEELDLLLQILNDRRLLLASIHNVEEKDMHHDPEKLLHDPKAPALIEIDFLAYVQGNILQFLMN